MQRKILISALLMAAGVATAGGLAYAKPTGGTHTEESANIAQARISLAQAVVTAEQHAGGRASRAELENENGRLVYGVEVAAATGTVDVKVDATDGSIVSAQSDDGDQASEDGREGDND